MTSAPAVNDCPHNLKNAQEYFEEHLCVGDYYNEGQRVAGEWTGRGAERLALSGNVHADSKRFAVAA